MNQNTNPWISTGTGRRKNSVARVRVFNGSGKVIINGRTVEQFFHGLERHKKVAVMPMTVASASNGYDFVISVNGGGVTGQAGAVSLSIARALVKLDANLKSPMRKEGLLTRDPRMVERKKPGQPKARKRFQFSKR